MLKKSRLMLLVSGIILILLLAAGLLYIFILKDDANQDIVEQTTPTLTEKYDFSETTEKLGEYYQDQKNSIAVQAENITEIEELKNTPADQQHQIGMAVVGRYESSGDNVKAREFAVYLMRSNSKDGLEATFKCSENSRTDTEKRECLNRAQEISKSLGYIGDNDNLPEDYLEPKKTEEQEG